MAGLMILPPAAKYLKKIKDKRLKNLYENAIKAICEEPAIGKRKHGDLKGVLGYDIYYNKTNYELAYTIKEHIVDESTETVVIIMAGTRENFYEELKQYWK